MSGRTYAGWDVDALIGPYPYRHVPHPDPEILARVVEREGLAGAWVGHLPSAFWRDPSPGNAMLYTALQPYAGLLRPVPTVRPDWPGCERALDDAVAAGAPAVRAYPAQWGLAPGSVDMAALAHGCAARGLVLHLTVRFEDLRQRGPLDVAGDLSAAAIRAVARTSPSLHLVVSAAGRELLEEVHWGLTPDEQSRVWWSIGWIWGPPEDHLAMLFRTVGPERFVYGTQWPLRLVQTPRANLELLPPELQHLQLADPDEISRNAQRSMTSVAPRA